MTDLKLIKHGILLEKTTNEFENAGVINPATIETNDTFHLFYRAVSKGNHSSIGHCKLLSPLVIDTRDVEPLLVPEFDFELQGMEDPRMVKIDDLYYLTYTGYDGVNALGGLAVSKDLKQFEKKGIIVPQVTYLEFNIITQIKSKINEKYTRYNSNDNIIDKLGKPMYIWDKNVILFPRKINDYFYFLQRIKPDIQLVKFQNWTDLTPEFWKNYFINFEENIVMTPKFKHEISYIGGGCPPIETPDGWLLIYHAVHDTINGYVYSACASLLDLNNPFIEIARLPYPLFKPQESWELNGEVNNVCFPTGTLSVEDTLFIYYGAADEQIACASLSLSALVKELLLNKIAI